MLRKILEDLAHLHPQEIDLSLGRMMRLLDNLGNPHHHLPPVIHIAGTNGKGSSLAMIRAIVEAAGLRVHAYTSPHLVRFAERIVLAGTIPDDEAILTLLEEVKLANNGQEITFFESTTAAAFLAFSRVSADLLLLETGLGGRLDATNVIQQPAVTVITPIDLDHQNFLGDSLMDIAREKAGIIKGKTPCIVARQSQEVLEVLDDCAKELGVSLIREERDFSIETANEDSLLYRTLSGEAVAIPFPALYGEFQHQNAAVALATVETLGWSCLQSPEVWRQGLRQVQWLARLHPLKDGSLVDLLPPDWELWLDGGHNPHAGRALAKHVAKFWDDQPLFGIFGVLETKDAMGILTPLAPYLSGLYCLTIPDERQSLTAEKLATVAQSYGVKNVKTVTSLRDALQKISFLSSLLSSPARVLIGGSLYLAGHVLKENSNLEAF